MTHETDFSKVFDTIASDIVSDVKQLGFPEEAVAYVDHMLQYTVPGGKMNRGISVGHTYQLIQESKGVHVAPQDLFKAHLLGWCVEILQAFFLVADDIMDQSKTRRGQPCWYLKPDIGNMAINDSFILESIIYKTLKKYFRQEAYYGFLLELFQEVTYQTELGQLMDLLTAPESSVDLDRFTLQRYMLIVEYKTAYYSFYLPVALALSMSGVASDAVLEQAKSILIPMGTFFQIQDDFLDCFGSPEVIGKIGTDIQDNKCSWLIVNAVPRCSADQLQVLKRNYGRKDASNVAAVKRVYDELKMEQVFQEYEEKSYIQMKELIAQVDSSLIPHAVYYDFAQKIYYRQK